MAWGGLEGPGRAAWPPLLRWTGYEQQTEPGKPSVHQQTPWQLRVLTLGVPALPTGSCVKSNTLVKHIPQEVSPAQHGQQLAPGGAVQTKGFQCGQRQCSACRRGQNKRGRRDTGHGLRETQKQVRGQEAQVSFQLAGFAGLKSFRDSLLQFLLSLHEADATVEEGRSGPCFPSQLSSYFVSHTGKGMH